MTETERKTLQLIESIAIDIQQYTEGKLDKKTLVVFMSNIAKQSQELRRNLHE
jgi:hypothetical protein